MLSPATLCGLSHSCHCSELGKNPFFQAKSLCKWEIWKNRTMFICRTLQKPSSVHSALCTSCSVPLSSTQQALWLWRSLRRNVMLNSTLQTSGFWVEGAYHWFHSFYTAHMPREREREREGGRERKRERALRESPWGLLFWWALNAYTDSCRHKCVWCWENLLLNIKTTQKAHQICISPRCSGVPPDFNRTCVGFLSFCTFEVPSLGFFVLQTFGLQ